MSFGFVSHWLKNWCEIFKPITKRGNRKHIVSLFTARERLSSHGRPAQTAKDGLYVLCLMITNRQALFGVFNTEKTSS